MQLERFNREVVSSLDKVLHTLHHYDTEVIIKLDSSCFQSEMPHIHVTVH